MRILATVWVCWLVIASGCGSVTDGDGDGDGDGDELTLEVSVGGDGPGAVTSTPPGIDCPGACSASFAAGTEVTLEPAAAALGVFFGWSGDCSGLGACVVTMDANRSVAATFEPSGGVERAVQFGAAGLDLASAIAVDGQGDVVIAGFFTGELGLGGETFQSVVDANGNATRDVFVAKLDRDGGHIWSVHFAGPGDNEVEGLAIDGNGDVFVGGRHFLAMTIDGQVLANPGTKNAFLARLDGASGDRVWARTFDGTSVVDVHDIAVDSSGDVIAGFFFKGTAEFGDGIDEVAVAGDDIVLAKYSGSNGDHLFSDHYGGDGGDDQITGIDVDGADNILILGYFNGTMNLGGVNDLVQTGTQRDQFIARYDSGGGHDWSRSHASSVGNFTGPAVVDAAGDLVVGGRFSGTSNFGGDDFTSEVGTDLYVAKYSGTNGSHVWSKAYQGDAFCSTTAVDVLAGGGVVVTGHFEGSVDFDGTVVVNEMRRNWWVARLDGSSGDLVWHTAFGDDQGAGGAIGRHVATGPDDAVFTVGTFNDSVSFGTGNDFTSTTAEEDFALVRLFP